MYHFDSALCSTKIHFNSSEKILLFQVVKELQVTMFQALVLLLFNEKPEWSYEEIKNATKIGSDIIEYVSYHFLY